MGAATRIFVPHMADHAEVLAAALRAHGLDGEVLPRTDSRTLAEGLRQVIGNECLPCIVTTGDIVAKCKEPGFIPERAAFLMPTAPGPCKFGQYRRVQRIILDRLGLHAVPIVSPSSGDAYREMGVTLDRRFELLAWRGCVAVDLLLQMRRERRPYEREPGACDAAYARWLDAAAREVEAGAERLPELLRSAGAEFAKLGAAADGSRPVVCIVGEIYVRANAFCNQDLDVRIERLGAEAFVVPLSEWFLYTNYRMREDGAWAADWRRWGYALLKDRVMKRNARELEAAARGALRRHLNPSIREILRNAAPYVNPYLGGEAALAAGWARVAVDHGFAGLINTSPFHCMPGAVLQGISKLVRRDHGDIPWLDLWFDAQEETHILTRLEAFMHQAAEYDRERRRREAIPA